MKKWLFNPFVYIAGARALLTGAGIMAVTAVVAYFSLTHFDGVLDAHLGDKASIGLCFIEQLTNLACQAVFFFIAGKIFSPSAIRFIDVAGTMALSRWPMLLFAFVGFLYAGVDMSNADPMYTLNQHLMLIGVTSIIGLVLVIWMVALMYNAFTVSCNLKGGKATGAFIGAIIVAEVVAHLFIHSIYKHFI